jgi:hypothetical protein
MLGAGTPVRRRSSSFVIVASIAALFFSVVARAARSQV